MIGAVVPSFDYALYARTTSALQRVLDDRGYSLVLAAHHYDLATEVRVTEQLIRSTASTRSPSSAPITTPRFTACSIDYGRPYVLTWGIDPARLHPYDRLRQREARPTR